MDNYDVLEVLHHSKNGSTIILKVKEKDNDNIYAMKLIGGLDNRFQRLVFQREVKALRLLNSCSDIVKIKDHLIDIEFSNKNNWGAILLDFVPGENLDNFDLTILSQLERYELCLKILKAIENAHNNDILHRDLKPSNIIFDYDTRKLKIIDFGTSKIKTIIEKETTLPLCSTNYSAPEVVKGENTTEASDIYSLGAVLFRIIVGEEPTGAIMMRDVLEKTKILPNLKSLILDMIQDNPKLRIISISIAIDFFEELIGNLNTSNLNFIISIDLEKLKYLKRINVVENKMGMSLFTNSYLRKQFRECYGYYYKNKNIYTFTGNEISIECYYNSNDNSFTVQRIFKLSIDRKVSNQRRSIQIQGIFKFVDSSRINIEKENIYKSDNSKLKVMIQNHYNECQEIREQDKLFDDLFGKWQQGLEESIMNEKRKYAKIEYSHFEFDNNQLILSLIEYNNIDEIDENMEYIIEEQSRSNTPFYHDIGTYSSTIYDENDIRLVLDLFKNARKSKIRNLLINKSAVYEDFRAKIGSYKKQLRAIKSLKDDDYSAKNLKDIILNISEPSATPFMKNLTYNTSSELNSSQYEAIKKALYSDNISLIQGPPGTGKTKVIKEIISKIVLQTQRIDEVPKILIVSQSHTAVDNIVEGLLDIKDKPLDIVRIGKEKDLSERVAQKCTMTAIRKNMFNDIRKKSLEYVQKKDDIYNQLNDDKEKERWEKIKEIQKDWIDRCIDLETLDYQVIKSATIIAGTCIGFLSNDFVKETSFDYVIIDEAAKATSPELLVSIIKAKKIILVGDQNQLPAYADKNISPIISKLTKEPKYRLFDILFNILPQTHKQVLYTQYRMKRNIGDLISKVFYNGTIDTGVEDNERMHNIEMYGELSIIWYDTSKNKNSHQFAPKGGSFINQTENMIIKSILNNLKESNELKNLDIGIITGYKGQKELIKKSVQNSGFDKIARQIDINTLDAFQGRENDVIIYSTVRTKNSIGFQKEKERVNVAFSRARKLLIICGSLDFFYYYDDAENKFIEIIDYLKENIKECKIVSLRGGEI